MDKRYTKRRGPRVELVEDEEVMHRGEPITEARAEAIAAELRGKRVENLTPGGKSLSAPGVHSPVIQYRVPADVRARATAVAEREGVSLSKLSRRALDEYLERPARTPLDKVRAGDTITLEHPNGDRIGPRSVSVERGPGGATWLNVERVGDVDPNHYDARFARPLERLLAAGWKVTSVDRD